MSSYCTIAADNPIHRDYHDTEYGFPRSDESDLFQLQTLELMQAGLSWEIILKKRDTLIAAFEGFDVDRVAAYGEADTARLLNDPGIIRNKLKVAAVIENANRIKALRDSHGGFAAWIEEQHPLTRAEWTKLFRKTFKFMGGEIVNEFLMCIGYLPGSHAADCPVQKKLDALQTPWMKAGASYYR